MTITVDVPFPGRSELGEGPHWHPDTQRLTHVDINGGHVHDLDPVSGDETTTSFAPPISFAAPVAGSSERILGCGGDLIVVSPDHGEIARRAVELDRPRNRFNDGKADPAGRFWFGSMSLDRTPGAAVLYCLDGDGVRVVDPAVTLSNGLDWDVPRERMYYIDSTEQRIDVFRYDVETGAISERRPFAVIAPADGLPDGMTVDADGCVWVNLFGRGTLRRYDPDGALMIDIALPTPGATCPVFGGNDLSTIFVTTSRHRLTEAERATDHIAGAILVVDAGVRGVPGNSVSPAAAAHLRGAS
jgi:sugar lactone lactonase YvrE